MPDELTNPTSADPAATAAGLVPDPTQELPSGAVAAAAAAAASDPLIAPIETAPALAAEPTTAAVPAAGTPPAAPEDPEYDLRDIGKMKHSQLSAMRDYAVQAYQQQEAFRQQQEAFKQQQSDLAAREKRLEGLGSFDELAKFREQLGPRAAYFDHVAKEAWEKAQQDPQNIVLRLMAQNTEMQKQIESVNAWKQDQTKQQQAWVEQQERVQAAAAFRTEYGKDPTQRQVDAMLLVAKLPANANVDRRFLLRDTFGPPIAAPGAPPPRVTGISGGGAPRQKEVSEMTKEEQDASFVARLRRGGLPI